MNKEKVLEIVSLKQTMSTEEIAKHLNYSVSKVKYWLRKARVQGHTYPTMKSGKKAINLN